MRLQLQEVPAGKEPWRGARRANLPKFEFCSWIFAPPRNQREGGSPRLPWDARRGAEPPRGTGLAWGAPCTVLAGLRDNERGSSRTLQRRAGSGRKQMHADLQWPSRVLHGTGTGTATPGTGTEPEAPLPLPLRVNEQGLMYTAGGSCRKADVEELLLSSLLQWPVPQP